MAPNQAGTFVDDARKFTIMLGLVSALVGGVGGLLGGAYKAEARVQEVAEHVVRQQWLTTLEAETKRIATEAAVTAAERAVNQSVIPLREEVIKHRAQDEQVQRDTDRRVDRLERKTGLSP